MADSADPFYTTDEAWCLFSVASSEQHRFEKASHIYILTKEKLLALVLIKAMAKRSCKLMQVLEMPTCK